MTRRACWAVAAGTLGPLGVIGLLSPEAYGVHRSIPAPFATWSVLLGHALGAALAWLLVWPERPRAWFVCAAVGLPALLAIAWPTLGPLLLARLVGAGPSGFAAGRVGWCLALALPGVGLALARETNTRPWQPLGWPARIGLAAIVSVAVPCCQVADLTERLRATCVRELTASRLVAAIAAAEKLVALGSRTLVSGRSPAQLLLELDAERTRLEARLAANAALSADPEATIRRGEALAQLDRVDEALATIAPWTNQRMDAALLAAAVEQRRRRFDASSAYYRRAAELARAGQPPAPASRNAQLEAVCLRAVRGQAFNERATGRPQRAEALYRQALADYPAATAELHFALARHYQQAGRFGEARREFTLASELDSARFGATARLALRELDETTPACIFGLTPAKGRAGP